MPVSQTYSMSARNGKLSPTTAALREQDGNCAGVPGYPGKRGRTGEIHLAEVGLQWFVFRPIAPNRRCSKTSSKPTSTFALRPLTVVWPDMPAAMPYSVKSKSHLFDSWAWVARAIRGVNKPNSQCFLWSFSLFVLRSRRGMPDQSVGIVRLSSSCKRFIACTAVRL